ncbi:MAG: NAD(+) synthase, partial [Bdellovibrionales bacterium]|nr:NAD(+) synthase [Bdellovibrionales bacterium]
AARKKFVVEGSKDFDCAYVYANMVGCDGGRLIFDGGNLIAARGEILVSGPRLVFKDVLLTSCDLDVGSVTKTKGSSFHKDPGNTPDEPQVIHSSFVLKETDTPLANQELQEWQNSQSLKLEEFSRAVALGLFDYIRKSKSNGCVVSLSGGADSSAVAVLLNLMVQLGISELGMPGFLASFSHFDKLRDCKSTRECTQELITCVYQSTRNSGAVTLMSATNLAEAIGANFICLDVDSFFQGYVSVVEKAIGSKINWSSHDVALQNIQARVRAPGIWLIANLKKALLLATSNRSEAAVGYATMDGDTCGGLSPIAGIDKAFLREWLLWMEQVGPKGVGAFPSLEAVNSQEPTAELRPPAALQTDEADLMPYVVLDRIERLAIRDKLGPISVFRELSSFFSGTYGSDQLACWVKRFYRLWSINQWKRERYAPSFHLDDLNLDPKTWCRFPILSGNFETELEEFDQYLKTSGGDGSFDLDADG